MPPHLGWNFYDFQKMLSLDSAFLFNWGAVFQEPQTLEIPEKRSGADLINNLSNLRIG